MRGIRSRVCIQCQHCIDRGTIFSIGIEALDGINKRKSPDEPKLIGSSLETFQSVNAAVDVYTFQSMSHRVCRSQLVRRSRCLGSWWKWHKNVGLAFRHPMQNFRVAQKRKVDDRPCNVPWSWHRGSATKCVLPHHSNTRSPTLWMADCQSYDGYHYKRWMAEFSF